MRVLMFGWEFPPHISGGLGTACFGLTQSLIKEKVKVLFVVPRIFGEGSKKSGILIDASLEAKEIISVRAAHYRRRPTEVAPIAKSEETSAMTTPEGMTYIEILANLFPYTAVMDTTAYYHPVKHISTVNQWNHAIARIGDRPDEPANDDVNEADVSGGLDQESHLFSGSYGPNLMNEVHRYAEVGGTIAKKYSHDVIHVHDWMTFPAGVTAKRVSKKPLIVHVHSTEIDRAGAHAHRDVFDIEKSGLNEADQVVTVSNWTKRIVMKHYGVPEEKITVIHNGIAPREEVEEFLFPDIGSHFVTFLGRVTHQKGPGFFVEAASKVLEEFPNAHFIVAGAGDLLPQIIERVAQLNMSSYFHFTGFLRGKEVDNIWSLTDVYVMPSVSEPFGIAPLEAIQSGVPVILSNQSGVSEVMPHAIKIDFWDVKALAAAICNVLRYESLSNELRQNSKQHIQRLTWDKAAGSVKAIYHELISKRKKR